MPEREALDRLRTIMEKNPIQSVRLVFCNASGIPCTKAWNSGHLDEALQQGINIFKGNYFMCLGVSPPPNSKFKIDSGDLTLLPDPDTFALLPYAPGTARMYRALFDTDTGEPWNCCARSILGRAFEDLADEGFVCDTAGELEFYLVKREPGTIGFKRWQETSDNVAPFSTRGLDLASTFISKAIQNLNSLGLDVTRFVKEGGPGQYELNISQSEGVKAADDILTLREVVKGTAMQLGIDATFMPKPFALQLGNGMHFHQSLRDPKSKKNVFADESDKRGNGMSEIGYQCIAGLLRHGPALCAVAASTVNSYRRLVPGWIAVDELKYGGDDRGAAIRIPKISKYGSEQKRIEYRVADPACNPYILLTCMLAAGLDGIKRNLSPDKFLEELDKEESLAMLPKSLQEAIVKFKDDQLFKKALGDTLFDEYVKLKEFELEIFNQQVSEFETEKSGSTF